MAVVLGGPVWADAADYDMTCDVFASHVQATCHLDWDNKGDGYRPDCTEEQTCKVAWTNEGNDCSYLTTMRGYCYDSVLNSIQCPENTYADDSAHGLCINCPPKFPYHEPFQYNYNNPGEKGIEYCYNKGCETGYSGNVYYNGTNTCTYTGSGSGGGTDGGGEDYNRIEIIPRRCSNEVEDTPIRLRNALATLITYCDYLGDMNIELISIEELDQLLYNECGLPTDINASYWDQTIYAVGYVCEEAKSNYYVACPRLNSGGIENWTIDIPIAFRCVERECSEALGDDWSGTAYGNKCSECTKKCAAGSTGYDNVNETIAHAMLCNDSKTADECKYQCAAGYYGTATSASTGCTKCPENATCAGGNNSTFVCNDKFYLAKPTDTFCTGCPENAICETGKPFKCEPGYYKQGDNATQCTSCPNNATCAGGYESFVCNSTHYVHPDTPTQCTPCPTGAKCENNWFSCEKGFYLKTSNATQCTSCPPNATCAGGAEPFVCNKGAYHDAGGCTLCPKYHEVQGTTATTDAKSRSECYVPKYVPEEYNYAEWHIDEDDTGYWGYTCQVDAPFEG